MGIGGDSSSLQVVEEVVSASSQDQSRSYGKYTLEEVAQHTKLGRTSSTTDMWLASNGKVYDISDWVHRHPGGVRVISSWGGQDATTVIDSMHLDRNILAKSMKNLCIGELTTEKNSMDKDIAELRKKYRKQGLFESNKLFYAAHFLHIIAAYALAYYCASYFGTGFLPTLATALLLAIGQQQAGWTQHDYGHLSVFKSSWLNHFMHHVTIGCLKGASSTWWNHRHFRHHAKPNVVNEDPDIDVPYLFLLGEKIPKWWATKRKGFMPYNWQQIYWFFIGPPLLLPTYFHVDNIRWVFGKKKWVDLLSISVFFYWHFQLFGPIYGGWGAFGLYMLTRFFESHWFTWVTQMSHIPMHIDKDEKHPWAALQILSTCDVEPSLFNDWFTGHLNYQVAHHLFPLMPRHNYRKITPDIEALCAKHNIPYVQKSLYQAFADIVNSLRDSGELWKHTVEELYGTSKKDL